MHFQIDQPSFGLSREFLIKGIEDKIVKAYYDYMVDTAVIYGADRAVAETELLEALNFEIALANVRMRLIYWPSHSFKCFFPKDILTARRTP